MLPTEHKARILQRAGVPLPARSCATGTAPQLDAGNAEVDAQLQQGWAQKVDSLYAQHALERATRSLQQAEASLQMGAAAHPSRSARPSRP